MAQCPPLNTPLKGRIHIKEYIIYLYTIYLYFILILEHSFLESFQSKVGSPSLKIVWLWLVVQPEKVLEHF